MRSLPVEFEQELALEYHSTGHLIEIDLGSIYYFTDKDMDVYHDSGAGVNSYLARGISFDGVQYSLLPKVDSLSFEVDNVSLEFSALVMNNETRGKSCVIYKAALDKNLKVIGTGLLFKGSLDRVDVDQQRARFEVMNDFLRWNIPTPGRKHNANCPWTFKDTDTCRYVGGGTWCDKSWDRCTALNNTINNGSFRWLPTLKEKQVYWGRLPG